MSLLSETYLRESGNDRSGIARHLRQSSSGAEENIITIIRGYLEAGDFQEATNYIRNVLDNNRKISEEFHYFLDEEFDKIE